MTSTATVSDEVGAADPRLEPAGLMARYCEGDRRAFDRLYALVAPRLLGYLRGIVGDRATAEDVLQQTFIKLHQARESYIRGADPVPWIYTIAQRSCLDELRRQKRSRLRWNTDDAGTPVPVVDITGAAPDADVGPDLELVARGMKALDRLPERQRQAVLLTKLEGRSTAEAAAILGTSAGAVKLRAHRGYVALRRMLGAGPQ